MLCLKDGLWILLLFLIDQGSKQALEWVALSGGKLPLVVVPGVFHITFVRNTGIAFSMLHQVPSGLLAVCNSLILLVFLVGYRRLLPPAVAGDPVGRWGLLLMLAGGLGNLWDRAVRGAVIDGLAVQWPRPLPVFNLADCFVSVGLVLLLLQLLRVAGHRPVLTASTTPTVGETDPS